MATADETSAVAPQITRTDQDTARERKAGEVGVNVGAVYRGAWWWSPWRGAFNLTIPWDVINSNSTVVITASETDGNGVRFVGSAPILIDNIAPGNGAVVVKMNINWGNPIPMRTDVLVFN